MKNTYISALIAIGLIATASAASAKDVEAAYPATAIGYDALASGDNDRAVKDMLNGSVSRHDPAFLLNLGQAYARMGRLAEAQELFRKASRKRESVDLVLADGRVVSSKVAARQALATVQVGVALR